LFKRIFILFAALATLVLLLFLALGYIVDAGQKPVKSDLIVSLGGGDGRRIKEALRLYQKGYSKSGKFLYTGREIVNPALKPPYSFSKHAFLIRNGVPAEKILYVPRGVIFNTAEELFFIRDYMQRHGYKSVLIVSSPEHTGRIHLLGRWVASFDKAGLKLHTASFHKPHWHRATYFLSPANRHAAFLELEKMIYNMLKYSPFTIDETAYAQKRGSELWQEKLRELP
jgi:uncharacterized SAM-binding protein YcdF (DUF218 family)